MFAFQRMLNFHLHKRHVNVAGMVTLAMFCLYGMVLIAYSGYCLNTGELGRKTHISFIVCLPISLGAPIASFLKPGFSYKGHPGQRHLSTLVSGSLIVWAAVLFILNEVKKSGSLYISQEDLIMATFYPLYGIVAIIQYWSFFKGPTSRLGRVFQPYLPTLE